MGTQVFSVMTKKFVRQASPEGDLISNPNIVDSKKLLIPTRLVIKIKPRFMLFQKIKYRVSDYTLEDCLGDLPGNEAEMKTSCMLEAFGYATNNKQHGKVTGGGQQCGGNLEGHNSSKVQMTFGQLDIMEFVNLKALRMSIKGRTLLLTDPTLKKNERLVLVKDRIVTTSSSPMESCDEVDASCLATAKTLLFQLQGGGDHSSSQNSSMTVPAGTVIAYNVIELNELNINNPALQEASGMKTDSGSSMSDIIYNPSINSLCKVLKELSDFEEELQFAGLENDIKCSLFLELQGVLKDRPTFQRFLEHTLELWWETKTREESVGTLLDQLPLQPCTPSHLAIQLLISTLDALPDNTLNMLANCSRDELHSLNTLVARLKTNNSQPLPAEPMPPNLQETGKYYWATQFLCSPDEMLSDGGVLWVEEGLQPGGLLLLLCIAVQGFVSLCG